MGYAEWRKSGRPFKLARPVADLTAVLRRYGYTVGTIGNESHLKARVAEDHTPYSVTGWPKVSPYPWGHACDVMPPPNGKGLPTLAQLGAQIVADRKAGVDGIKWLKYINCTDAAGHCEHHKWAPDYKRVPSNDVGHIHLSARTDCTNLASKYDPVARFRASLKPTAVKPKSAGPPFPGRVIRRTNPLTRGNDVLAWQRRMKLLGFTLDTDGIFGPRSEAVLKRFQRQEKLTADGVLGPVSWRAAWSH